VNAAHHSPRPGRTVAERLVSLDGSAASSSAAARTGLLSADKKTVLVERRPADESLLGVFQPSTSRRQLLRHPGSRADAPESQDTGDHEPPRTSSVRLPAWIDESTAMPLKTSCVMGGPVIEQIVFASLTLSSRIPDTAFKPDVSTEGFRWLRNESRPPRSHPRMPRWSGTVPRGAGQFTRSGRSVRTTRVASLHDIDGAAGCLRRGLSSATNLIHRCQSCLCTPSVAGAPPGSGSERGRAQCVPAHGAAPAT